MEDELNVDSILSEEEVEDLFTNTEEETQETSPENKEENNKELNEETTEVDADELFAEEPESVGSEEDKSEEKEDTTSTKSNGTSPNFYSSIASALREDGILPDLDDETVKNIKEAEDFAKVIETHLQNKFDERQKRIDEALNSNVEVNTIKKYENALNYLDSIKDEDLEDEGSKGENLRKQLIYQDYLNRGFSEERAKRYLKKSLDSGTDIEDAKEALSGNKEFFNDEYNSLIEEAKQEEEKFKQAREKEAKELKKSILDSDKFFGDIQIDDSTKKKIYDNISKPVYKDPETGDYYTAIQKYQKEHKNDFIKNIGIIYTLTDGFENLDKLVKGKVKKEVKRGLKELEHTINHTSRTSAGALKFISGGDDPNTSWSLDI